MVIKIKNLVTCANKTWLKKIIHFPNIRYKEITPNVAQKDNELATLESRDILDK